MPNPPSSTQSAKQSSHLAPRDELGAWQARQAQEGLTQRRKDAKFRRASGNFAPLRLCVSLDKRPQGLGLPASAPASWSAVAQMRGRSLASVPPLSSVHRFPQTLLTLAKRCRASLPTALHDAGASLWKRLSLSLALPLLLAGCFFHPGEEECFAPNITWQHLTGIEKDTGVDLPDGSTGLAFYSCEVGHPYIMAKIKIPSDKLDELLASKPFTSPQPDLPANHPIPSRLWWKPSQMMQIKDGEFHHKTDWVRWHLGKENNDSVLYILWMVIR